MIDWQHAKPSPSPNAIVARPRRCCFRKGLPHLLLHASRALFAGPERLGGFVGRLAIFSLLVHVNCAMIVPARVATSRANSDCTNTVPIKINPRRAVWLLPRTRWHATRTRGDAAVPERGFRIEAPLEVPHDAPQRLDCSCCSARGLRDYAVHATPADAASLS
jgi:hypothetical protein